MDFMLSVTKPCPKRHSAGPGCIHNSSKSWFVDPERRGFSSDSKTYLTRTSREKHSNGLPIIGQEMGKSRTLTRRRQRITADFDCGVGSPPSTSRQSMSSSRLFKQPMVDSRVCPSQKSDWPSGRALQSRPSECSSLLGGLQLPLCAICLLRLKTLNTLTSCITSPVTYPTRKSFSVDAPCEQRWWQTVLSFLRKTERMLPCTAAQDVPFLSTPSRAATKGKSQRNAWKSSCHLQLPRSKVEDAAPPPRLPSVRA
ncbi:hypothetical protein IWX90DRAFT_218831 [Phyllosticta citrichinensis]|uniref:Uncharacterized protein n=1 Tax=Phyllosticta citrichinensis TaxID=1130410 RepID=A0ABR1XTN1_9PEZI